MFELNVMVDKGMVMTYKHLRSAIVFGLLTAMTGIAALPAQALPPKYRVTVIRLPSVNLSGTELNNAGQVSGLMCTEECFHTYLFDRGVAFDIKPDLPMVFGRGMNSRGDIVGGWSDNFGSGEFVYIDGRFQTLPDGDFDFTRLLDINSSRQVVGNGFFVLEGELFSQAFIWEGGTLSVIPAGPFAEWEATQINNAGQVSGVGTLPTAETRGFLYDDGETVDLGTIPGAVSIRTNLLSGTGIVAGSAFMTDGTHHAVRSKDGAMIDLGQFGSGTGLTNAINNAGQLVGSMATLEGTRAFFHDGAGFRNLGTLGGVSSAAGDITDNGQIVGSTFKANGVRVGFVYGFGTDTMYDLNKLVDPADPLEPFIKIRFTHDVNEFGQILASGRNESDHRYELMLLTPVDSTKPVVRPKLTGTKGTNGWFKSDISLVWTLIDEEAPVGSKAGCAAANVTTDTASKKFTCVAKSIGGTNTRSVTVKRDETRPTAMIARPAPGSIFNLNQVVTASFGCSDETAGIQSCVGKVANGRRIDTSKKVTNATFSVKATDRAGLTRTLTTTYSVR